MHFVCWGIVIAHVLYQISMLNLDKKTKKLYSFNVQWMMPPTPNPPPADSLTPKWSATPSAHNERGSLSIAFASLVATAICGRRHQQKAPLDQL